MSGKIGILRRMKKIRDSRMFLILVKKINLTFLVSFWLLFVGFVETFDEGVVVVTDEFFCELYGCFVEFASTAKHEDPDEEAETLLALVTALETAAEPATTPEARGFDLPKNKRK